MDPVIFDDAVLSKIDRLGLDVQRSDNRFLDILPRGVSKGPSLLRLLEYLCVPHRSTLVAGDTLNDLSMLSLGIPAVAVGGSEAELIRQLSGEPYVYCADGAGVNGIVEAIYHHQFLTDL